MSINAVINKEILITGFKVGRSKYKEDTDYITVQFVLDNTRHVFFTGSTLEIMNTGDIASPIHVEIPGPCTNPNLENLSTNEIISLTLAVADGETVVIDTTYSALYCRIRSPSGTESNAMQYLTDDSTFWQIIPGINIVTYTAASGSGTVTIKCPSRYTGI